jgi:hypothetical protein
MPVNSQTSYWSGPILSAITLSCNIHTGRIGAISDQFALGTPWDEVRRTASQLAIQFRHAHGVKQPATLHEDELEYQEGWKERRARPPRRPPGLVGWKRSTSPSLTMEVARRPLHFLPGSRGARPRCPPFPPRVAWRPATAPSISSPGSRGARPRCVSMV